MEEEINIPAEKEAFRETPGSKGESIVRLDAWAGEAGLRKSPFRRACKPASQLAKREPFSSAGIPHQTFFFSFSSIPEHAMDECGSPFAG